MAEMGEGNADRIVDLGRRGESGIEILPVELADQFEADIAGNCPVEFPAGKLAARLAPDVDREGGAALWKNCSAWSFEKMIQRSGLSARSLFPTSAATCRTCSTVALSSVSGIVKNWGAWGSMAPPITVDVMITLLSDRTLSPLP